MKNSQGKRAQRRNFNNDNDIDYDNMTEEAKLIATAFHHSFLPIAVIQDTILRNRHKVSYKSSKLVKIFFKNEYIFLSILSDLFVDILFFEKIYLGIKHTSSLEVSLAFK
jgi:hypothetical protein